MTTVVAGTYSEAQRIEVLSALAACDGMPKHAAKRLAEQGTDISWTAIRAMREQNAGTYQALAAEINRSAEEALTIEFRELARLGQRATRNYIEDLVEKQESGTLNYSEQKALPQIIQALQKTVQVSTDKMLSLTGRPIDGGAGNTMVEAIETLERLGLLERVERPALPSVPGTAEEVE